MPDADDKIPSTANVALRSLWTVLQQDSRGRPPLSDRIPSQIREAVQEAENGLGEAARLSGMRGWHWPDESWLEQLQASGIEAGLIPSVVRHVEVERLRLVAVRIGRKRKERPEWPLAALDAVTMAICEERGRQLLGMTDAMNRFAEAVYSTTGDPS